MAWPNVATGDAMVPALLSLPAVDTKTPNISDRTHGSLAFDGKSVSGKQSPLHA
jgi:hypothetical protein